MPPPKLIVSLLPKKKKWINLTVNIGDSGKESRSRNKSIPSPNEPRDNTWRKRIRQKRWARAVGGDFELEKKNDAV
ncbi:hypothetical protein PanWU01x14_172710 [Parasponia andersonii]|uniref:Uncharacterized protein n=1 Tax=Parasponia andersonii TaxID=3476 RepID=A0A2P5C977_PARAD|nr:hypothetical protein PanWU01x14_172710 [Parasponia andersonii]